jgi:tetratricopeptide (TPR) repeat protein
MLCALVWAAAAQSAPVRHAPSPPRVARSDLERASEDFRAGRYGAARSGFDTARSALPPGADADHLAFDAAVCSYALEEYADAQQRFESVAAVSAELAPLARVNAGLAALRRGDLATASRYSEPTTPLAPEVEARRQVLLAELSRARRTRADSELHHLLDTGFDAIEHRQFAAAREALTRALSLADDNRQSEIADAQYGLGVVATELGDPEAAERHFAQSLARRPDDAHTLLALGRSAEDAADRGRAARAYEAALALPLSDAQSRSATHSLDRLYLLPPTGATAFISLGAGYDSNATQSGVTDLSDTAVVAGLPSAYASTLLDLGVAWRAGRHTALGLNYGGDLLALFNPAARDLSLQSHELVARAQWAPLLGLRLRLDAGGAYVLSGLSPMLSYEWDSVFGAQLDLDTSSSSRARLNLSERLVHGMEYSYLDGQRFAVTASELWRLGRWELSAQAYFRLNIAGIEPLPLAATAFPACTPNCDRRHSNEPLSYRSPGLGVGAAFLPLPALRLFAQTRAELRSYLDAALVTGIPASRKVRRDARWRSQLGAEYALDAAGTFRLTLEENLLLSGSNVAANASDPQHQYDYGDYNFVQSTTELGVSATFP